MSRDLGDARLLFRGSPWGPRVALGLTAAAAVGVFVAGLLQPWSVLASLAVAVPSCCWVWVCGSG